ncbi:hypothetical protein HN358_01925 [Candidatus Uhrbacteria bacterium]|jgi:hypothetical protein|nr:hypothetical protein [Candidatus Uhrbacteria bacterium]MBT7716863.1 hypothetical protein [Candidatus Uhrbacteria bacterium]
MKHTREEVLRAIAGMITSLGFTSGNLVLRANERLDNIMDNEDPDDLRLDLEEVLDEIDHDYEVRLEVTPANTLDELADKVIAELATTPEHTKD